MSPLSLAIDGPADSSASLAIVNRSLAAALARQPGCESVLGPPGQTTTHLIRNMYPPRLDAARPGVATFFYFAWEDSRIPAEWARAFNRHFDGLLVPSVHVRDVVRRSGVVIPVAVVPYGVDSAPAPAPVEAGPWRYTDRTFRFLHVSTGFPRKGCDVLLRAFAREFSSTDDVALIVKTLPQYDHPTARLVRRTRWTRWRCPEIVHIDRDLDAAAMQRLYASASCLVHPARAEGFGLPIAEAMRERVPVIASDYSGHKDFCTDATALLIPCRRAPSRSPFVVADAEWGEPDERALRHAMRHVFEHRQEPSIQRRIAAAHAHVNQLTWDRAAARTVRVLHACRQPPDLPIRAAMLTTWQERCGIAEYSRALVSAVGRDVAAWTILAPHRPDAALHDRAQASIAESDPPVIRCWRDDWPVDIGGAIDEVRRRDVRVLHVQAHLNAWGSHAASALAHCAAEGRRVLMTLHSVRDCRPDPDVRRALAAIERILVHTEDDRLRLRGLGLSENVAVLPHGFPEERPVAAGDARAALGVTGAPVIGTYGFLRPHKNTVELIGAAARLRRHYPEIGVLAVTALYPAADSAAYLERCRAEARRLGLDTRCRFLTDFLAPADSLAALHACDVIVMPYSTTLDSSSAAVRVALAARRPVITTAAAVFADVAPAVHTVRSPASRHLAAGIRRVLATDALRRDLAARAEALLSADAWPVVAATYRKLLLAGVVDDAGFSSAYPIVPGS